MPKRTRERQLAKLAARRQAEKARLRRRRNIGFGLAGLAVALVLLAVAMKLLGGPKASAAATPSATVSPQPSPCGSPTPPASASQTKPTFPKAPPMTIDENKTYTATFKTSCGSFTAQLLPKIAPIGVNNFVFLANQDFYDGLVFQRIVKGFIIQGGDPTGDGKGDPGYEFKIETSKDQTFDSAGLLAYANSGPDSNGSQFFVTLAKTPQLDPTPQGSYTIFGKVTNGMDVVKKIGSVPTVAGPLCAQGDGTCSPVDPIFILNIKIAES